MNKEYALLSKATGLIVNVLMTQKSLADVKADNPKYDIVLLDNVSIGIKQKYQYWSERP